MRPRLTYANVVSTLCLFLLLCGGAYAAGKLQKNSVGTKQIKKEAVTAAKVKKGTLTGTQINASTLGTVPSANQARAADAANHAAVADTASALGKVVFAENTSAGPVDIPACSSNPCTADKVGTGGVIAVCPPGTVAISGGGGGVDPGVELSGSFPTELNGFSGWEIVFDNYLQTTAKGEYFAVCTKVATTESEGF